MEDLEKRVTADQLERLDQWAHRAHLELLATMA